MKLWSLLLITGFMFCVSALNAQKKDTVSVKEVIIKKDHKHIVGYYASWQMYDRNGLCRPANINYEKYTILTYAFFTNDDNGNLFGVDPWADSVLLRGNIDWGVSTNDYYEYIPNTSLIDLAHVNGVKVMVSIGGWTLGKAFPKMAANPAARAHFASECVRIIRQYQFDGIDIDWEYPGHPECHGTPQDKDNFTLLMRGIRDSIDVLGKKLKRNFILSGAFGASRQTMENIDWDKVVPLMDMINLMSYDYEGVWSAEAGHNCPLYKEEGSLKGCIDESFRLMVNEFKVPSTKINFGIAFYGRSLLLDTVPALYAKNRLGKADLHTWEVDEGSPCYYSIVTNKEKKHFEYKWDSIAQVPYLISKPSYKHQAFLSYDDPESIRLKVEYIMKHNAAGVLIWEISGDYMETSPGSGFVKGTPLLDEIYNMFPYTRKKTIRKRWR